MSGHSKWATIHRKKGELDAQRGKVFQKIAKEIMIAAKGTNGNPNDNPGLRAVIEKARSNNMPKDNIQKAIDKAVGGGFGADFESLTYEGYAQGGVAIMIDCLTDNRNRTAMLVRSTLTKKGGNLGTDGSVSYLFERKGVLVMEKKLDEDLVLMTALDNGAQDVVTNDDSYEVYTLPNDFLKVKDALEEIGVNEFITSEITFVPNNYIDLDDETSEKVQELIEALEDIDDVQNVYHNLNLGDK